MQNPVEKYGFVTSLEGRSLVICQGEAGATAKGLAIVALFQRRYPRTPGVLLRRGVIPDAFGGLAPELAVDAPYPLEGRRSTRRLLKRTRARMLLLCGGLERAPALLIERAYQRGVTVVVLLDTTGQTPQVIDAELSALRLAPWRGQVSLLLLVADDALTVPEAEHGLPPAFRLTPHGLTQEAGSEVVARLEPLIAPSRREVARQRGHRPKHSRRLQGGEGALFRAFLARKFRTFPTLDALNDALGHPDTILCLGNGPSSEDESLRCLRFDALFRVNMSWLPRGFLTDRVDLVFTVLPEVVEALRPRVGFVFKTLEDEATMRSRYLYRLRRLSYATAEALGVYDRQGFGSFSPTNGAVMLAVAVALRPKRLVVAGIDLFSHPAGAYPGDNKTANDYTMGHEKGLETAFVLSLLRSYTGTLDIVGPVLRDLIEKDQQRGAIGARGRVTTNDSLATTGSSSSLPQSAFGTPKRYQTLRARWRAKKPTRAPGHRPAPVLLRLDALPGVVPSARPPVRIFLGTEPDQYRAERVFVWSVLRTRDPARAYEIYLMKDLAGYNRRRWTTGFTNYRYAIPTLAGGAGRAIYNDVDQIYLSDPAELFDTDMNGAALLAINQQETSVMLMDCAQLATLWRIEEAQQRHEHAYYRGLVLDRGAWGLMPGVWNARDFEYAVGKSKLLHYTTLYKQPWQPFPEEYRYQPNELSHLWHDLEREADAAGFTVFTAERPSPTLMAMRQRGAEGRLPLSSGQIKWHARQLQRRLGRSSSSVAELGDSGLNRSLPQGLEHCFLPDPFAANEEEGGAATAAVAIGTLERLPEDDIPWALDLLFRHATGFVYVAATAYDSDAPRSEAEARSMTLLPRKWWEGQLEAAARRNPGRSWVLALREVTAKRGDPAWAIRHSKSA